MTTPENRKNAQWWAKDVRGKEHERLMPTVNRLRLQDGPRREACLRRMRMYGNYSAWSSAGSNMPADRLRYNLIKQGVDTLLAEITASKPKSTFLVTGGDWTLRQAAKSCDQLIYGQMRENEVYDGLGRAWEKDCEITGTGVIYDYIDMDSMEPRLERVLPLELLVDDADGRYGKPRCIYRQRVIDRGVLIGMYPKAEADIKKAAPFSPLGNEEWLMREIGEADLVLVVEAWHLRSSKRSDDGRYVVAIENATLKTEAYADKSFPFTILRWEQAPVGFWGIGVAEQLESDQIELNRTLRRIQEAAGTAAGVWLVRKGSRVKSSHLTDVPGTVVEFEGAAPDYKTPSTVPMDLIQHADRIIARALQRLGISESFANAIKPVGLNSGEAQRVHADIYSRRQVEHSQSWESAHLALAKRMVCRNHEIWELLSSNEKLTKEELDEYRVNVEVRRGRKKQLKRLRWDEVELPENQYVVQAYPTSSLPTEPSGRAALITEWMKGGLIDAQTAKILQDMPDTDGTMDLELADYDFALFAYETMIEDGKYVAPEPYQNLEYALELIRRSYLRATIDGAPDERLDLVRDHMDAIRQLMQKAAPVPAQATQLTQAQMPPDGNAPPPDMAGVDPSALMAVAA